MVVHQPNLMEGLCLKGGDFETGITGLSNRSLHMSLIRLFDHHHNPADGVLPANDSAVNNFPKLW
jgi:hypothetical protein